MRSPLLGLTAAIMLTIAACAEPSPIEPESPSTQTEAEDPLANFYEQSFTWEDCSESAQEELHCGSVTVPMKYSDPQGESLEIALAARGKEGRTPLLINPGGPGASGVDAVLQETQAVATDELLEDFVIVGFDPRGVHRSEGIECVPGQDYENSLLPTTEGDLDDAARIAAAEEAAAEVAEACAERTGELLGYVDTASAAADMDIIRAVLGEEQLNYLGSSYGTKLGMAYAEEFPEQVGRFVLDGMIDVSLPGPQVMADQARGFEDALHRFAAWCANDHCPVAEEPEDVVGAVADLFDDVAENPRTADDGRLINISTLVTGFITPMYSPQGWPMLRNALDAALVSDDLSAFQHWADLQAGRNPDGSYDWLNTFAFRTITCLDYPSSSSRSEMADDVEAIAQTAPTFGPYFGHAGIFCRALPHEPRGEPWEPRSDLPEMLFIGTTGDPATPVEWSESMHSMVPASSLLTVQGEGHLAYRPGADCVTEAVDDFLRSGELFEGRQTC